MKNNCQVCALSTKHFWKELALQCMCCTGGLYKHSNVWPGSEYLHTAVQETYTVSMVILPPSKEYALTSSRAPRASLWLHGGKDERVA